MADPTKPEVTATPGEKPKRKVSVRRVPEGHEKYSFHLPKEDHDVLLKLADDEDRQPNDMARILIRKAVRNHSSHPKFNGGTTGTNSANTASK